MWQGGTCRVTERANVLSQAWLAFVDFGAAKNGARHDDEKCADGCDLVRIFIAPLQRKAGFYLP